MAKAQEELITILGQQTAMIQLIVSIIATMDGETATWVIQELENFCGQHRASLERKGPIKAEDQIFCDGLYNILSLIKQKIVVR